MIPGGPKSNDNCPYNNEAQRDLTETHKRRKGGEDKGKD